MVGLAPAELPGRLPLLSAVWVFDACRGTCFRGWLCRLVKLHLSTGLFAGPRLRYGFVFLGAVGAVCVGPMLLELFELFVGALVEVEGAAESSSGGLDGVWPVVYGGWRMSGLVCSLGVLWDGMFLRYLST